MNTSRYAYSLNGTDWRGEFATRKDARLAAMAEVKTMDDPPREVYVGKLSPTDPQATGHALAIIKSINQRLELSGKSVFLTDMKVNQVAELDQEIAATIVNWLRKHNLAPAPCVSGISEYPVPLPAAVKSGGPDTEVRDLGIGQWVGDF